MKVTDRLRVLVGKQPKRRKSKRFRYLDDGVTKVYFE